MLINMKRYNIFGLILINLLMIPWVSWADETPHSDTDNTMVVEEDRTPEQTERSRPESITIIDEEEIRQSGARTVAEILQQVEGIDLQRYGSLGQMVRISIRGSTHDQVLILVNGRPINPSVGGGGNLSQIPINAIKQIEIIRGGASAIYGGNAMGGAINIITKTEMNEARSFQANVGYGSFNTVQAGILAYTPFGREHRWYAMVAGQFGFSEGDYRYEDQRRGSLQDRENSSFIGYGISGEWGYHFSDENEAGISLSILHSFKDAGVPGSIEFPTIAANQRNSLVLSTLTYINYYHHKSLRHTIISSYQNQWREYTDQGVYQTDDTHLNQSVALTSVLEGKWGWNRWKIQSEGAIEWLQSTALEKLGGEGTQGLFRHGQFGLGIVDSLHLFPYENSAEILLGRIVVVPALRISWDSRFDWLFSYQLGIIWNIDAEQKVVVKSTFKNGYRLPSYSDMFWSESAFARGNPDLLPEKGLGGDITVMVHPIIPLQCSVSGFITQYSNLIVWNPGAGGQWRPMNLNTALGFGGEAAGSYYWEIPKLMGGLELTGSYSLQFIKDKTPHSPATFDKQLPRRPHEKILGKIHYLHYDGHFGWLAARYVGFRYLTAANTRYLEPYVVLDARVGLVFKPWHFSILVLNLLNQSYVDLEDFPVPGIEIMGEVSVEW
jgi:vitamin B12 transporter